MCNVADFSSISMSEHRNQVPELANIWYQIIALDTRFSHIRPCMHDDSTNRQLYLRRRHQLFRERSKLLDPGTDNFATLTRRQHYHNLRDHLLSALYGKSPTLQCPTSKSCSRAETTSFSGSLQNGSPLSTSVLEACNDPYDEPTSNNSLELPCRETRAIVGGHTFSGIEHVFAHHKGAINRLRFANNDNTRLAIASADGTISICCAWPPDVPKQVIHILTGGHQRQAAVTDVVWSLSNDFLASTSVDGTVCMWNTSSGILARHYSTQSLQVGPVLVCGFQPQNYNLLVVGGAWGVIQTMNLSTGKPIKKGRDQVHSTSFQTHKLTGVLNFTSYGQGCVTALAFEAAFGTCLWVGTDRGIIQSYICQPSTGRLTRAHRHHIGRHCAIPIASTTDSGSDFGSSSSFVVRLSTLGLSEIQKLSGFRLKLPSSNVTEKFAQFSSVTCLSVYSWLSRETSDSFLLANAAGLGLLLFRITPSTGILSSRRQFPLVHHPPDPATRSGLRLLHSCFAPLLSFRSGACAVTASEDSNVYIFNIFDKQMYTSPSSSILSTVLRGHTTAVLDVAIGWDEGILASGDELGSVIIWHRIDLDN
ncbi:unnamed protein product [Dicrocoelium dendriticum]|nr:unnamed protein product [Dicrocoelium dendriticum]